MTGGFCFSTRREMSSLSLSLSSMTPITFPLAHRLGGSALSKDWVPVFHWCWDLLSLFFSDDRSVDASIGLAGDAGGEGIGWPWSQVVEP